LFFVVFLNIFVKLYQNQLFTILQDINLGTNFHLFQKDQRLPFEVWNNKTEKKDLL